MRAHPPSQSRGFSLLELLVVMAIIAVIASFAIPAASTILRGSQLTQASQMLSDQISLARQLALSRNRAVEVRFYRYGDPEAPGEDPKEPSTGRFRAIQSFEITESGAAVPLNKMQKFPSTVLLHDGEYSSILDDESQKPPKKARPADPAIPGGVDRNYEYISFRFYQDGSTNLKPTGGQSGGNWFVTVMNSTDAQRDIKDVNFFTMQIDPVSGSTKSYRPNAG
jgi:uncharacterized protein (TIGR02596 family)